MALKDIWAKERSQRLTEIAERKLEVAQHRQQTQAELRAVRQDINREAQVLHTMLDKFVTNLHETGLAEKQQRQLENAERYKQVRTFLEEYVEALRVHEQQARQERLEDIASRKQEVLALKLEVLQLQEQFSSERALMSQKLTKKLQTFRTNLHNYVWGSQEVKE
ncbi:MAG: hypothetical protein F6K22_17945 [Okeania sp. SIO2F4]|uniref:hypothetical protein n=1 Tax=Okeania sp. SIO2F4 TaxID=2607790 RepID=UPI001429EAC2|nr:hypothetical protein [Okeania sp. SIO2F4]NES04545.1 hypothetical protein [Okeania sp. SIO2F4]